MTLLTCGWNSFKRICRRKAEELYQMIASLLCQTGTNAMASSIAVKTSNMLHLTWKRHASINTAPPKFIRGKKKMQGND